MLFIQRQFSVDRFIQANKFNVYRESKACGHVLKRVLDNRLEPVD